MILETGKEYKNGWGRRVTIMGPTRDHPEWVYSLQGDWYERTTGKFVRYHGVKGHYVPDRDTNDDIKEESL